MLGSLTKTNRLEARFVMNRASLILPVSRYLEKAIKQYGIKNRYKVIPNTVNTDFFYPPPFNGAKRKKKRILTVAMLTPVKGLFYLFHAVEKLKQHRQDFTVDVVGDGPDREADEELSARLGINELVRFHGLKSKIEVANLMRNCDIYVQPSLQETFGVTFIEAMACGKPIIATALPALQEKIAKDRGVLVPPEDVNALARALDDMLNHYQDYASVDRARDVHKNYGYESIGKQLSILYDELVTRT